LGDAVVVAGIEVVGEVAVVDADWRPHSVLVFAADLEHHLQRALPVRFDEIYFRLAAFGNGEALHASNS
jgi:hypothetical protein